MKNDWKLIRSREIFDNPWITVKEDEVINPGGGTSQYGHVHFKNYALGIIPLDTNLNTWLVGQWRYTLNEYSWEIPMGGGSLEMDRLDSAKRELREETGLRAGKWTELLKVHTSNSVTNEIGFVFLAEELSMGETAFEETEKLEIRKVPLVDALEMCDSGEITDGLSLAGLFHLSRILKL